MTNYSWPVRPPPILGLRWTPASTPDLEQAHSVPVRACVPDASLALNLPASWISSRRSAHKSWPWPPLPVCNPRHARDATPHSLAETAAAVSQSSGADELIGLSYSGHPEQLPMKPDLVFNMGTAPFLCRLSALQPFIVNLCLLAPPSLTGNTPLNRP